MASMICDDRELEDRLSAPDEGVVEAIGGVGGDVVVAGAGGKMGLALARMVRRAQEAAGTGGNVTAVSRFSNPDRRAALEQFGIRTWQADLLDRADAQRLPDASLVIAMVGVKFGTSHDALPTWGANVLVPVHLGERYAGVPIVAFSSGNVYPLVPVESGGARPTDPPGPVGEYAMSALARERMYEYACRRDHTPLALIRLNYACELRYGVLVDIARWVWEERPVPLAMGHFNVIWEGDAIRMALRAAAHTRVPGAIFNVTGPDVIEVRRVAEWFGRRWNKPCRFEGAPEPTALLSDARSSFEVLGHPEVPLETMLQWIAWWIENNKPLWNKPTHFEVRDGRF